MPAAADVMMDSSKSGSKDDILFDNIIGCLQSIVLGTMRTLQLLDSYRCRVHRYATAVPTTTLR